MKFLLFSMKRVLKTPAFCVFLLLAAVLPSLAAEAARGTSILPGAVFAEDPADEDAAFALQLFLQSGFLMASGEEDAVRGVAEGIYNEAVILPAGFGERLAAGEVDGIVRRYSTDSTTFPEMFQTQESAVVAGSWAPYVGWALFRDTGVGLDEILREFRNSKGGEGLVRITMQTMAGETPGTLDEVPRGFFLGALSLLVFLAAWYGIALPLTRETRGLQGSMPLNEAVRIYALPGLCVRMVLLVLAAASACLLAGRPESAAAAMLYALAAGTVSMIPWCFPGRTWQSILGVFIVVLSLALCPIFLDFGILAPLRVARIFLPPYWLWAFGA